MITRRILQQRVTRSSQSKVTPRTVSEHTHAQLIRALLNQLSQFLVDIGFKNGTVA